MQKYRSDPGIRALFTWNDQDQTLTTEPDPESRIAAVNQRYVVEVAGKEESKTVDYTGSRIQAEFSEK